MSNISKVDLVVLEYALGTNFIYLRAISCSLQEKVSRRRPLLYKYRCKIFIFIAIESSTTLWRCSYFHILLLIMSIPNSSTDWSQVLTTRSSPNSTFLPLLVPTTLLRLPQANPFFLPPDFLVHEWSSTSEAPQDDISHPRAWSRPPWTLGPFVSR